MNVNAQVMEKTGKMLQGLFVRAGVVLLLWTAVVSLICIFPVPAKAGQVDRTGAHAASGPATVRFPALVDVGAKQCIPCKMMEPILEELRAEYAGVLRVEFIDVQVDPQTATKLGVRGIPTQIFYDASGKERYRHMGYMSKERILATFKRLGIELVRKDGGKKAR